MKLIERQVSIPVAPSHHSLISHIKKTVEVTLSDTVLPIRFVITGVTGVEYNCELGILEGMEIAKTRGLNSIFSFVPRKVERTDTFNAVFLVPTGIGAEIGGHAGDATPAARVIATACDTLVTHPNVVNASDLNEMPENTLYVEGSSITQLLMGTVGLQRVRANRVLVIVDAHETEVFVNDTVNAVSAARATYGFDCVKVVKLDPPLRMTSSFTNSGRASGEIEGLYRVCAVLDEHEGAFDAVAIASVVDVPDEYHKEYFRRDGKMVNPWGGVEAMLTHSLSMLYGLPTAHSPMLESQAMADFDLGLVEPRLAAEAVSFTFLQCMLKGLHRSPRIISHPEALGEAGIFTASDVSCLVIPDKQGGLELNFLELALILEEMGRVNFPGPYFSTVVLGGMTILEAGNAQQKDEYLPLIAEGKAIFSMALTEPTASWAPSGIEATAKQKDDQYIPVSYTHLTLPTSDLV